MAIDLTLSHSQVQAYNKCKFYWKLKYVDGWMTVSTDASNRGTIFHQILNNWYTHNDKAEFGEYLHKLLRESGKQMTETARLCRIAERYISEFVPASDQGQTTLALEQHFVQDFKTPEGREFKIQGYIDRIYKKGGRVFIEDFKTLGSASWWSQGSLLLDSQLTLYAALAPSVPELQITSVDAVSVTQINCYEYKRDAEKKTILDIVRRETAYRTQIEQNNVLIEFGNAADEMLEHLERKKPFNKALTKSCDKCEFSEICQFSLRGVDVEPFLASRFERKTNPLSIQLAEELV